MRPQTPQRTGRITLNHRHKRAGNGTSRDARSVGGLRVESCVRATARVVPICVRRMVSIGGGPGRGGGLQTTDSRSGRRVRRPSAAPLSTQRDVYERIGCGHRPWSLLARATARDASQRRHATPLGAGPTDRSLRAGARGQAHRSRRRCETAQLRCSRDATTPRRRQYACDTHTPEGDRPSCPFSHGVDAVEHPPLVCVGRAWGWHFATVRPPKVHVNPP